MSLRSVCVTDVEGVFEGVAGDHDAEGEYDEEESDQEVESL